MAIAHSQLCNGHTGVLKVCILRTPAAADDTRHSFHKKHTPQGIQERKSHKQTCHPQSMTAKGGATGARQPAVWMGVLDWDTFMMPAPSDSPSSVSACWDACSVANSTQAKRPLFLTAFTCACHQHTGMRTLMEGCRGGGGRRGAKAGPKGGRQGNLPAAGDNIRCARCVRLLSVRRPSPGLYLACQVSASLDMATSTCLFSMRNATGC